MGVFSESTIRFDKKSYRSIFRIQFTIIDSNLFDINQFCKVVIKIFFIRLEAESDVLIVFEWTFVFGING